MSEGDLTATSCTVGFVGADSSFTILSDADLEPHVAALKDAEDAPAGVTISLRLVLSVQIQKFGDCNFLVARLPDCRSGGTAALAICGSVLLSNCIFAS